MDLRTKAFFKQVINEFKQMNYCEFEDEKFYSHEKEIDKLINHRAN